jgi:hypothetical protein
MFGLILIYFIGKAYYDLAKLNNRHPWGFAVTGIAAYYAGTFIAGLLIGYVIEYRQLSNIGGMSELLLGLMVFPFGLLSCWGLYKFLQSRWKIPAMFSDDEILDSGLLK